VSELVLVGVVEATPISTSIVLERALLAQVNYGDDQFTASIGAEALRTLGE